ncbi:hypothetical protein Q4Q35_19605 [Flavivirga aquimarina]|uniref:FRG domain-containing protein n=1 Tax=Flavivirga aquimarina TaxID=2027862 RepID=A0ABT8WFT3_9FLAO|nr:hypothetical protein [Flavivirga aquimarina]MDO5972013.1 hypothetical protein [Flavivirga aquimarina]
MKQQTIEILSKAGIDDITIKKVINSGYHYKANVKLYGLGDGMPCISDTFYGSKMMIGYINFETFVSYLKGNDNTPKFSPPIYKVKSLKDALQQINEAEGTSRLFKEGLLSFRGQAREYHTKREIPNPFMADTNNKERLVIPSFYRKFVNDFSLRFNERFQKSIFQSIYGDEFVYYGIENWHNLGEENFKRYGIHTMSDLESFPDKRSQEYGKRWSKIKVSGDLTGQLPLIEQHYGMPTYGLDVTFELSTALFFASHKFKTDKEGYSFYEPIEKGKHQGVLYGFRFRDPSLVKTRDMVNNVPLFDHLKPERPIRQSCALPIFNDYNFNSALTDCDFIMYLDKDFDIEGVSNENYLIPPPEEDPFYKALVDIGKDKLDRFPFNTFARYKHD